LDSWTRHLLQQAAQFFDDNKTQAYLTGGSIRDILQAESCTDWDIVIAGDAPSLSRKLANKLDGYYAHMHAKASRITVKHNNQNIILDVSPIQGHSIEADLQQRDFTINAIAVPLADAVRSFIEGKPLPLIDPLHGAGDLEARCLKAVNDTVFKQDPLRMLRAIRFMARYNFTLDDHTKHMLRCDAAFLPNSATERIHAELYAILEPDGATDRLHFLDEYGLFTTLLPEFIPARGMAQPALHHWDVLEHSIETVGALERLATTLHQTPQEIRRTLLDGGRGDLVEIQSLLHEAEQQNLFQYATLTSPEMKMASLLHDIGKTVTYAVSAEGKITFYGHPQAGVPLVQTVVKRLSLSTQDRRFIQQVVANHMRPGQLSHDVVTQRAVRRYFVDLGPVGIQVALVSLADHLAMRGPEPLIEAWEHHLATVRLLLTRYIREREVILPPRLLQAEELMRKLNLEQGPLVGQLLEYIAEAQADGMISSKDDAFWFAQDKLEQITASMSTKHS